MSALGVLLLRAVFFFIVSFKPAWLFGFVFVTTMKNRFQASVDFLFHHFFNDFEKLNPFIALPFIVVLAPR